MLNKNMFRLISVFSVFVLAVVVLASGSHKAEAAAITSSASGDWNTGATWVGGVVPGVGDTVTIASGHVITMSASPAAASIASLTINNAGATTGLTMSGTSTTLTVTGAISIALPSADGTSTLAVADANLVAAGITMTGGASPRIAQLTVTTGTITSSSGISFAGTAAQAKLTATGAATITLSGTTGTLGTGGTVALNSASTTVFSGAAQTVNTYTYGNVSLSGSGIKTIANTTTIASNLAITSGTTVTLANSLSTANKILFNGSTRVAGTYGADASSAAHKSDIYFTSGVTTLITVAAGSSSSSNGGNGGVQQTITQNADNTNTSTSSSTNNTPTTTQSETPATPTKTEVVCAQGEMFSPTTGEKCTKNTETVSNTPTPKAYAFGTSLVKKGSKGEACKAWQMYFNDKGNAGLTVDGHCGPKTIAFAKTWQASVGLKADGVLGAMSRAKAN